MKKIFSFIVIFILSLVLVSCENLTKTSTNITAYKTEIVEDKYGKVDYLIENIMVYKNNANIFPNNDEIDYIVDNKGSRGSVEPEFKENFYLFIDLVIHEGEYKSLVYDNMMSRNANKNEMFVLTNNLLSFDIEQLNAHLNSNMSNEILSNFISNVIRKDEIKLNSLIHNDFIDKFYDNLAMGETFYTFHDYNTCNFIIIYNDEFILGNSYNKEIFYPENKTYDSFINDFYDQTLNGKRIYFSLDEGNNYQEIDKRISKLNIMNTKNEDEILNNVFFYATNYIDFLEKVETYKNPNIVTYNYFSDEQFDNLINIYDEEFFEDHLLIFYYKYEPYVSENYVHSLTKLNDQLYLNINRFEGSAAALSSWNKLITVKKDDIVNINKINLILRTISPE